MKTFNVKVYTDGDINYSKFDNIYPSYNVERDFFLVWENISKDTIKIFLESLIVCIEETRLSPLIYVIEEILNNNKIKSIIKENGNYSIEIIEVK